MWSLIKSLLAKWVFFRWLLKSFGSLAFLIPIALLLKALGWPVILVLLALALPVLAMLAIFGLPLLLVFLVGGVLLSIIGAVLSIGLTVLKIVLPIVAIVWVARWLFGGNGGAPGTAEGGGDVTGPPPSTTGPAPATGEAATS